MLGTGYQRLELGKHLAAIANPQGQGIRPRKKLAKHVRELRMIQDGAGPAGPSAQNIAIREPSADSQHLEIRQGLATA